MTTYVLQISWPSVCLGVVIGLGLALAVLVAVAVRSAKKR